MYSGEVDMARAEAFYRACTHPFVFNGDLSSVREYQAAAVRFPRAAGFMIGRGALINPFLPRMILGDPQPDEETRRARLRSFHDDLAEGYEAIQQGRAFFLRMREHWTYWSLAFASPKKILKRITHARDMPPYHTAAAWALDQALRPLAP
jgi:tRNA-dihydrouridine synthase